MAVRKDRNNKAVGGLLVFGLVLVAFLGNLQFLPDGFQAGVLSKLRWFLIACPLAWSLVFLAPGPRHWRRKPEMLALGLSLFAGSLLGFVLESVMPAILGVIVFIAITWFHAGAAQLERRLNFALDSEDSAEPGTTARADDERPG